MRKPPAPPDVLSHDQDSGKEEQVPEHVEGFTDSVLCRDLFYTVKTGTTLGCFEIRLCCYVQAKCMRYVCMFDAN